MCGHTALVLGLIGLLLPLVPTSPFMIVAGACYAKTSDKFYQMLIRNRYFGPPILHWRENRCVEKRIKLLAYAMLAVAFTMTGVIFTNTHTERLVVFALALIALVAVSFLPVCRNNTNNKE